ncbi:MAG: hypothetical protein QM749_15910 [Aquabacterium sp.]
MGGKARMDSALVNRLVFLWWNTGLTPPVSRRNAARKAMAEDSEFVIAQLRDMRNILDFGVLGLCEVQERDLDAIMQGLADPNLRVIDKTDISGRTKSDIALIYDESKVLLVNSHSLVEYWGKRKFKLGEMMTFVTLINKVTIHVVLSHWPSRLRLNEKDPKRAQLGMLLAQSLADLRTDPNAFLVLMGDFNDDPFSPSLSEHLLATRDRELAKRDSRFFYNPFWRWLGESHPSSSMDNGIGSVCGTHYYRNGDHTEWYTYDQMIFTSAFLNRQDACLDEELTQIISTPELSIRLRDRNSVFDHFPVTSAIKLRRILS